jgi:hypothetical protein
LAQTFRLFWIFNGIDMNWWSILTWNPQKDRTINFHRWLPLQSNLV